MWTADRDQLTDYRGTKVSIRWRASPVSYQQAVDGWYGDRRFRQFFIDVLADCPYQGVRWETPPATSANLDQNFEFVLLDSPDLVRAADAEAFAEHFGGTRGVVEFSNLGGDALMIVPEPATRPSAYSQLGAFVRHAPRAQQHLLWRRVGEAMRRRLGAKPLWLNTAGAGIAWLHLRLDSRPKYYVYAPYRRSP